MERGNPYDGVRVARSCGVFSAPFTLSTAASTTHRSPANRFRYQSEQTIPNFEELKIDVRTSKKEEFTLQRPVSARTASSKPIPLPRSRPQSARTARSPPKPLLKNLDFPTSDDPIVKLFSKGASIRQALGRPTSARGLSLSDAQRRDVRHVMKAEDAASRQFLDVNLSFQPRDIVMRARRVEERRRVQETKMVERELIWAKMRQRHTNEQIAAHKKFLRDQEIALGQIQI